MHELKDTLLQGFLGASILLDQAVEQTPADSPSKPALSSALRLVRRAIDEGRAAIQGLHTASPAPSSLERCAPAWHKADVPPLRVVICSFRHPPTDHQGFDAILDFNFLVWNYEDGLAQIGLDEIF